MKITRFQDIPQFTRDGGYEIDTDMVYLLHWLKENGPELEPDFQRGRVWTTEQQVAFIEYFLRGGKTGRVLYFNCPSWMGSSRDVVGGYDDFVCVDGLQRITAVKRFVGNEIRVFGSFFNEFTDRDRRSHRNTLRVNVNTLKTKAEVLQWYLEMNTGGTPHTKKEIDRVRTILKKVSATTRPDPK